MSDNLAYYRKYRPQTLLGLVGQDQICETLQKSFTAGKLSHAYLLCGPRGTGKTSTARILAKMVNCELAISHKLASQRGEQSVPCNKCSTCLSITDGSNLDLIEIDAASNRGIDDIRELRDKIKLAPTAAKKKIYIIDEVHMLTTEAFNALLKTLEEPPAHALFILATTDPQKIPQTILSRVTRIDFQQATVEASLKVLKNICQLEKLKYDDEALKLIAKKGEGSFRDSVKLLDQLASTGEKISVELVEKMLRNSDFAAITIFLESLLNKDSTKSLELIQKQLILGISIKEFSQSLVEYLRMILLLKNGATKVVTEDLSEEKFQVLQELAEKFPQTLLIQLLESFMKALEQMKFASIQSLPLEIAVVESCASPSSEEKNVILEGGLSRPIESPSDQIVTSSKLQRDPIGKVSSLQDDSIRSNTDQAVMTIVDSRVEQVSLNSPTDDVGSTDMLKLSDKWTYILETIKPYNYSLEALLRQVKVASIEEGLLVFEVPYSFHQRILESPKSRDLLESVISDVLSKSIKVSCVLGKRPVRIEELANIELAADDDVIKIAAEIFNSDGVS